MASPFVAIIPLIRGGENVLIQFIIFALVEWPIVLLVANRDFAGARLKVLARDKTDVWKEHASGGLLTRAECFAYLPFGPYSWLAWVIPVPGYFVGCSFLIRSQFLVELVLPPPACSPSRLRPAS